MIKVIVKNEYENICETFFCNKDDLLSSQVLSNMINDLGLDDLNLKFNVPDPVATRIVLGDRCRKFSKKLIDKNRIIECLDFLHVDFKSFMQTLSTEPDINRAAYFHHMLQVPEILGYKKHRADSWKDLQEDSVFVFARRLVRVFLSQDRDTNFLTLKKDNVNFVSDIHYGIYTISDQPLNLSITVNIDKDTEDDDEDPFYKYNLYLRDVLIYTKEFCEKSNIREDGLKTILESLFENYRCDSSFKETNHYFYHWHKSELKHFLGVKSNEIIEYQSECYNEYPNLALLCVCPEYIKILRFEVKRFEEPKTKLINLPKEIYKTFTNEPIECCYCFNCKDNMTIFGYREKESLILSKIKRSIYVIQFCDSIDSTVCDSQIKWSMKFECIIHNACFTDSGYHLIIHLEKNILFVNTFTWTIDKTIDLECQAIVVNDLMYNNIDYRFQDQHN